MIALGLLDSAFGDDLVLTGDLLLELCHEYRGEYADDAEDDEHPAHGGCEQAAYIAVADAQRAAQALFADGSKDEREDDRRRVQIKLAHQVAEAAEDEHDDDVAQVAVDTSWS